MPDTQFNEMVDALKKDGSLIIQELTPANADLWHMVTGVSGEAGELLDAIKKEVIYRKPLDMKNVVEELGDLEFYMQGVRSALGITREETLVHCREKLAERYANLQYSNDAAIARADKV